MGTRNYAAGKPTGDNNVPFFDSPPAFKAIVTWARDASATASSILNLSHNTTAVEVAAIGSAVFIRWVGFSDAQNSVAATSVISNNGSANFDHAIPSGTVRRFVVPIETVYTGNPASQVGAAIGNGLFRYLAIKTAGVGSIATTEYGKSNAY